MEEDQNNVNIDDKKLELKNLLISNPREADNEASSSNEEPKKMEEGSKEKDEDSKIKESDTVAKESKKKSENSKNKLKDPSKKADRLSHLSCNENKYKSRTPSPSRNSPEPSCAICLEQLTNKSFTNSCFHMFCFTCLVEWSKVKPECPLCKQSFTSIVHNVKSFQEYDQYHISARSRTPETVWSFDRRFRYSSTMTPERLISRAQVIDNSIVNEIASHRLRYAPHSVHHIRMFSQPQMTRRMPSVFRRRVYEENLWVHPPEGNRVRLATPSFFQRNIACTHRLLPWLNRELLVVMPHNEGEIGFMIDLIMSLILKYNITSQEFFTHIEPYTGPYTSHFIHEFYNFAISPYEMETYDYHARYDIDIMTMTPMHVESSPDSDVIPLHVSDASRRRTASSDDKRKKKQRRRHLARHLESERRRLEKIILKRNSQNIWETVSSFPLLDFNVSSQNAYEGPGPSTSWNSVMSDFNRDLERRNETASPDDDDIEIVQVLKPKSERTPEIINLSSDEENFSSAAGVTSDAKDLLSLGVIELSSDAPLSSADDDEVLFLEQKQAIPDKPIDYSLKAPEKSAEVESENTIESVPPSANTKEAEVEQSSKKKISSVVLKSAVQAVSNEDSRSSSWSPSNKPKRKRIASLEGSSTESCSEDAHLSELDSSVKKLKLRSVVAHFMVDNSSEKSNLSHHSSHKKRKESRKKKKKHKHKHYRIYSSDSS